MKTILNQRKAIVMLLFPLLLNAQNYAGFKHDNYSGLHGVINNPALVVGSPYNMDLNLISVGAYANNDYTSIALNKLLDGDTDELIDLSEDNTNAQSSNNFNLNAVVLGPSFMFNINETSAIALLSKARVFTNISDIDGGLYDRYENGFEDDIDYSFSLAKTAITSHVWAEFGLVYGSLFSISDNAILKTGIGIKYLKGMGSAHASFKNFDADYTASSNSLNTAGEIAYGSNIDFESDSYEFAKGAKGFGFDIGAVYLWNDSSMLDTSQPKNYTYRVGVSITDIGSVSYPDATQTKYDVTQNNIDAENIEGDDFETTLESIYPGQSSQEKLKVKLPTAAHINIDWNINNSFYANLNADLALSKKGNNANRIVSNYTLTPRFEKKWISAYSPLNFDSFKNFGWGFGLRAGPLFVGSNTIISALMSPSKKADVHVGLKIPLYKKNKDQKQPKGTKSIKESKEAKKQRKEKEKQDKELLKQLKEKSN